MDLIKLLGRWAWTAVLGYVEEAYAELPFCAAHGRRPSDSLAPLGERMAELEAAHAALIARLP